MLELKVVSEREFREFLKNYPNELEKDLYRICEPCQLQFNDFSLGDWPESIVAAKVYKKPEIFKIMK